MSSSVIYPNCCQIWFLIFHSHLTHQVLPISMTYIDFYLSLVHYVILCSFYIQTLWILPIEDGKVRNMKLAKLWCNKSNNKYLDMSSIST